MTQYTQRRDCKALDIKGCPSSMVSESNIDSRWIMLTEMHWTISKASVIARIPPFQQAFLSQPDGLGSIQEACVFTGPPSPMFGDVPCFDRGGRLDPIVESWGYWVVALHFQWFYIILSRIRRCLVAWFQGALPPGARGCWRSKGGLGDERVLSPGARSQLWSLQLDQLASLRDQKRIEERWREKILLTGWHVQKSDFHFSLPDWRCRRDAHAFSCFPNMCNLQPLQGVQRAFSSHCWLWKLRATWGRAALYRALGKTPKLSTQGNKGEKKERGTCHWC